MTLRQNLTEYHRDILYIHTREPIFIFIYTKVLYNGKKSYIYIQEQVIFIIAAARVEDPTGEFYLGLPGDISVMNSNIYVYCAQMEAIKAEVSRTIARLEEQADAQWARRQGQGTAIEQEFLGHLADCVIRKFVEYSPEDYRYFVFQTYTWIHRNYGSRVCSEWAASVKPRIEFYALVIAEKQQRTTDTVTDYREDKSAVGPQIVINSNNVADGHETTDVDMEQSSMVIEPAAGSFCSAF